MATKESDRALHMSAHDFSELIVVAWILNKYALFITILAQSYGLALKIRRRLQRLACSQWMVKVA